MTDGPISNDATTAIPDLVPGAASATAVEVTSDLVFVAGGDRVIRYANAAARAFTGLDVHNSDARCLDDVFTPTGRTILEHDAMPAALRDGTWRGECALLGMSGVAIPVRLLVNVRTRGDGSVDEIVVVSENLTERLELGERLAAQAMHDPLTGLANRALFLERLSTAMARAGDDPTSVGVMFVDLDNFKYVNDSLGHEAGDRLLALLARRFEALLRDSDLVGRFGGDEFLILCEHLGDANDALDVARRIVSSVTLPFMLDDDEVFLAASAGLAVPTGPDDPPESLLRDASIALYRAKELGKSRVELFEVPMRVRSLERLQIDRDLRRGLAEGQFRLLYQPIVNLESGTVAGFEALLRWEREEGELLAPDAFLSVAEDTGIVVPIGAWALREACRQTAWWHESIPEAPPFSMSVNLSGRELALPDLAARVAVVLDETGVDPSGLTFELRETAVLHDFDAALAALKGLCGLGVRLSIDDFGTGFSSLGYLKRLPVDSVKIDRAFIDGLGLDDDDTDIVGAVVSMAHALGLTVIAEGVETPEQLHQLEALGCDAAQGFYFARPQPAGVVAPLLRRPMHWRPHGHARLAG